MREAEADELSEGQWQRVAEKRGFRRWEEKIVAAAAAVVCGWLLG